MEIEVSKNHMQLFKSIPDFDRPIEALYICHDNILARMRAIGELSSVLIEQGRPAFDEQIGQWAELFSFVKHTVANHTRDEEEGLFPMMAAAMSESIRSLRDDHAEGEETERWLAGQYEDFVNNPGEITNERLLEFAERARAFAGFYQEHIHLENTLLFPTAQEALSEEQLRKLGRLMREHRRITITVP